MIFQGVPGIMVGWAMGVFVPLKFLDASMELVNSQVLRNRLDPLHFGEPFFTDMNATKTPLPGGSAFEMAVTLSTATYTRTVSTNFYPSSFSMHPEDTKADDSTNFGLHLMVYTLRDAHEGEDYAIRYVLPRTVTKDLVRRDMVRRWGFDQMELLFLRHVDAMVKGGEHV